MQSSHGSKRFKLLPDGTHEHHLPRKEASEALLNFTKLVWKSIQVQETEVTQCIKTTSEISPADFNPPSSASSTKAGKYGKGTESIGYGSSGSVRLSRKSSPNNTQSSILYAIKSYRRGPREPRRAYRNRATSSFCISSCLNHPNILNILELIQDEDGTFSEVMSFCPGGNLTTLVLRHEKLPAQEADCFFAQLLRGVEYIHSVGVAHRDLKPENLLLTSNGVLKIADFGEAECFRYPWEEKPRTANGRCGTIPFIAPEVYLDGEFDPRPVDVWATGMIYMAMRTGKLLWGAALRKRDAHYCRYLDDRKLISGFRPIERLQDENCRSMIYAILNPSPSYRPTASEVLGSQWCREIQLCNAAMNGSSS